MENAVRQAFEQAFNEQVPRPAIVESNSDVVFCSAYVTSNAWLGSPGRSSTLLSLKLSSDGMSVTRSTRATFLTPAGTFRALTVLVGYPETVGADAISLLEGAQRAINDDYASFSAARGYGAPLVTFNNTNVRIPSSQVSDARTLSGVVTALSQQGIAVGGYDFLVSINIDPARSEGGFATPGSTPAFIYMGNFSQWKTTLSASNMTSIAGAVYHHEVIHHWGWPGTHDWACANNVSYGFNFRVPPVLLGWEDVDGDRVPEVIDSTPYGRSGR